MQKYTIKDFESFQVVDGRKQCPTGDYKNIIQFPDACDFASGCVFACGSSFGKVNRFDDENSFGKWCNFDKLNNFGASCSFGELCSFGKLCNFGERCNFGYCSSFGESNSFDVLNRFGENNTFGESNVFGKRCTVENGKEMKAMLKFEGFGSVKRCTYFFFLANGSIYVRCGCFAGTLDEFREQVKETHGNNNYAKGYFKVAELAEWQFKEGMTC